MKINQKYVDRIIGIKSTMVHCPTRELAEKLLYFLEDKGYTWVKGQLPSEHLGWKYYKSDTCYNIRNDYRLQRAPKPRVERSINIKKLYTYEEAMHYPGNLY